MPRVFTPLNWQSRIQANQTSLLLVDNTMAALMHVENGEAQVADIEYHVARYIAASTPQLGEYVIDMNLPYQSIGFSLSSIKHPQLIEQLNKFINDNPGLILTLKQQYKLALPCDIKQTAHQAAPSGSTC